MKTNQHRAVIATVAVAVACLAGAGCRERPTYSANPTPTRERADRGTAADDTQRNVRDRDAATVTPTDQGGSEADRRTTQRIRQAIVRGTNEFSMAAENIKIITIDGKVTLRGPVKTAEERAAIVAIAEREAGAGPVDDQLEVQSRPQTTTR